MMRLPLLAILLLAAGTAHAAEPKCKAERAQPVVGQAATIEQAASALRLSGARQLRWTAPWTMQTMDHREDRLNLELDSGLMIVRASCG